jgi:hypothetical protein
VPPTKGRAHDVTHASATSAEATRTYRDTAARFESEGRGVNAGASLLLFARACLARAYTAANRGLVHGNIAVELQQPVNGGGSLATCTLRVESIVHHRHAL